MESRKYSAEELQDLITGKGIRRYAISFVPEKEDFEYEDSAPVTISLPRGMWKIVYAASKANECSIGEMVSDLACDSIWKLMQEMLLNMLRKGEI